jgi:hypothetical protein
VKLVSLDVCCLQLRSSLTWSLAEQEGLVLDPHVLMGHRLAGVTSITVVIRISTLGTGSFAQVDE